MIQAPSRPAAPAGAKVPSMTLQLRGMFRVVQDNRAAILRLEHDQVWEMTLAAVQLAQAMKLIAGELE